MMPEEEKIKLALPVSLGLVDALEECIYELYSKLYFIIKPPTEEKAPDKTHGSLLNQRLYECAGRLRFLLDNLDV